MTRFVSKMATDFLKVKENFLKMSPQEKKEAGIIKDFVDPAVISQPKYGPNVLEKYSSTHNRVLLWTGDITTLGIDAIVNAANSMLAAGGGVCGAIHRAAGKELSMECKTLGGCPTSKAVITGGYRLPAKYVIHAVGPQGEYPKELEETYRSILQICKDNNLKSVAIPCISTGIYGYPQDKASAIAVRTVLEALPDCVEKCILCTFLPDDTELYKKQLSE